MLEKCFTSNILACMIIEIVLHLGNVIQFQRSNDERERQIRSVMASTGFFSTFA